MTAFWFVVSIMATYRVANLVSQEDGPFDVFSTIRERLGQTTWVGRGMSCLLCVSWWLAVLPAVIVASDWREFALLWPGIAGGVLMLKKYLQ